jgi:hypothetical protein
MIKLMTPFKPTQDDYLRSVFDQELRRKIDAYEKAHPEEYMPLPPLDLRTVPREEWDHYQYRRLIWPPDIQLYVESTQGEKWTVEERNAIGERMEKFYGVSEPYFIDIHRDEKVAMLVNPEE